MEPFRKLKGLVVPLDRANVDTDAIIPKQYLKSIKRTGFGPHLFDNWRYHDTGEPGVDCSKRPVNEEFELNHPRYQGGEILLARENFGCGSSREHAPWALLDHGFRVVIAPSFAEIFHNNCIKNGILPVTLPEEVMDRLFEEVVATPGHHLEVDLEAKVVRTPGGDEIVFDIHPTHRHNLLHGLDEIGLTLEHAAEIRDYEEKRMKDAPWLFKEPSTP